ncbi:hypothetical protein [Nannocystis bainbridge]|uniref:Uncharacterized protein n=1 Tax=Nannocystis bainbridge TaxID=2995303 RepID=A0ABT5DTY7_9BACT|nr:hypothetical protein [Nannocystis bainbridge]MDC0715877.1 hypothetical protein [Nannocystis bainbridge]
MSAVLAFTALLGLLAPESPPPAEPELPKRGPPLATDCATDCDARCTWDVCPHPLGCFAALDEACHTACLTEKKAQCPSELTIPP